MKMVSKTGTTYIVVNEVAYFYGMEFGDDGVYEEYLDMIGCGEIQPSSMSVDELLEV